MSWSLTGDWELAPGESVRIHYAWAGRPWKGVQFTNAFTDKVDVGDFSIIYGDAEFATSNHGVTRFTSDDFEYSVTVRYLNGAWSSVPFKIRGGEAKW